MCQKSERSGRLEENGRRKITSGSSQQATRHRQSEPSSPSQPSPSPPNLLLLLLGSDFVLSGLACLLLQQRRWVPRLSFDRLLSCLHSQRPPRLPRYPPTRSPLLQPRCRKLRRESGFELECELAVERVQRCRWRRGKVDVVEV